MTRFDVRFGVGDILQPVDDVQPPETERDNYYYLVKRITSVGLYDVENIGSGEKLYGMGMVYYRKIP